MRLAVFHIEVVEFRAAGGIERAALQGVQNGGHVVLTVDHDPALAVVSLNSIHLVFCGFLYWHFLLIVLREISNQHRNVIAATHAAGFRKP